MEKIIKCVQLCGSLFFTQWLSVVKKQRSTGFFETAPLEGG